MSFTVFFITNNYKPYSGGVVSSIEATANALRKYNIRVIIITLDYGTNEPLETDVYRVYCPVTFTYQNNPMAIPWNAYSAIVKLTKKFSPAVFHVHHPFLLGTTAVKVAKKLKIPVVFTYHTQYDRYLHYIPITKYISKPTVNYLVSNFCKKIKSIIAPSTTIALLLQKKCPTPTIIIPSPLAPYYCTQTSAKHTPSKPYKLLCISRFTQEKNIYFLLDVIEKLKSYPVTLSLIGYGCQQKALQHYAYNILRLSQEKVTFTIRPPKSEILKAYQQADLFIFASQTETQGLVLAESMSQGTPVIALPGSGINDIIISGYNGYVVSSIDTMAQKIRDILDNPSELKNLQEGALRSSYNFFPDRIAFRLIDHYVNLTE